MIINNPKLAVRLVILLLGLASGLLFQMYKFQLGTDSFWNIRLPLAIMLGLFFILGLTYVNNSLLKIIIRNYDIRTQLRDMLAYLPFLLLFLFPLQQKYFRFQSSKDVFLTLLIFYAFLAIIIKCVILVKTPKTEAPSPPDEKRSPVITNHLYLATFFLLIPTFWFHQFSYILSEFYSSFDNPLQRPVRDNDITRMTILNHGETLLRVKAPFENSTAVIAYKVFQPPRSGVNEAIPLSLRLRIHDEFGNLIADYRRVLAGEDLLGQHWREIEVDCPKRGRNKDLVFDLRIEPAIFKMTWSQIPDFILHPPMDSEYFRGLMARVGWSAPEFFSNHRGQPNIILISADTLRADTLGCYGYGRNVSPAIDLFAREHVKFENAFSQSTWTLPSHLSLFTGKYPGAFGEYFMKYVPSQAFFEKVPNSEVGLIPDVTLAEILRDNGYYCAAFTDGVLVSSYYGFSRGFHIYDERYGPEGNSVRLAQQWIEQNAERPFFVFVHSYIIHDYFLGLELTANGGSSEEREEILTAVDALFSEEDAQTLLAAEPKERERDWYDVRIRLFDHYVGELFSFLQRRGLYETSFVIFFSDHGEAFDEIHNNGKTVIDMHGGVPYESLIRIPLILKPPPGSVKQLLPTKEDVRLLDLIPTILAILEIETDSQFHGRSLFPGLYEDSSDKYSFVHSTWRGPGGCIREGNSKYFNLGGEEEFYDLKDDPLEMRNLSPLEPKDMVELRNKYSVFIKDIGESKISVRIPPGASPELRENLKALGYLN